MTSRSRNRRRHLASRNHGRRHIRSIRRTRKFPGADGILYVSCRICGEYRRVISGRHLSKHGTNRETYMQEYGLSTDELIAKEFRQIQSSRRGYQPYGRREWITAIKKIHRNGGSVFAGDLQHTYLYHQGVWIFCYWDKALRAAGFDPETMRQRRSQEPGNIIKQIHRLRNRHLPLYARYVMKNHPKVFSGARRVFGSWDNSLRSAGLELSLIPEKRRLGWLRELRDTLESGREISRNLRLALIYYFGSLRKARRALKTDPTFLKGWNKRKISMLIVERYRAKQTLAYTAVFREFFPLVSAAERYFGSWGKALYAAGIDPNFYFVHHTWRNRKMSVARMAEIL